eukprot:GHVL01007885.1.p1 GENE.GHVL01007885.1~~GHVL01007885.1.p1  ORF type:complete len:266 (+),score=50.83 GHVL01007885.1:103-900(+)
MGCPLGVMHKKGAGSLLLRRRGVLEKMVKGMSGILRCPLTIKMRSSHTEPKPMAHTIMSLLPAWGIDAMTIHPRSAIQRYTKTADWDYVRDMCAPIAAHHSTPLIGSGDILSWEEAEEHLQNDGVSSVMIGRGALIKPWIFTEIKERRDWDISSNERLQILKKFTEYGLEHWGSDDRGCETTRRFLLEFLSFFHRYIPLGVLERYPQKMNWRPPSYFGRNVLETKLASSNSQDWIEISEMFLGPVKDGYAFIPKHKSNSYETVRL